MRCSVPSLCSRLAGVALAVTAQAAAAGSLVMSGDTFWQRPLYGSVLTPGGEVFDFDAQFLQLITVSVKPDDTLVFDLDEGVIRVHPATMPYALITTSVEFSQFDPAYDLATYSTDTLLFDVGATANEIDAPGTVTYVGYFPYGGFINLGSVATGRDADGDGINDDVDNCPSIANADQADFDGDSIGDVCDADDDNDGLPDSYEIVYGLDPFYAGDAALDFDGDGLSNLEEYENGTRPDNVDTDHDGVSDFDEVNAGTNPRLNPGAVTVIIQMLLGE